MAAGSSIINPMPVHMGTDPSAAGVSGEMFKSSIALPDGVDAEELAATVYG